MLQECLSAQWFLTVSSWEAARKAKKEKQLFYHVLLDALLPPVPCAFISLNALDFPQNNYNWAIFKIVKALRKSVC